MNVHAKGSSSAREGEPMRAGGVARGRGLARERGIFRGPWTPDFAGLEVAQAVMDRGIALWRDGRVRELVLFPGIFHVTGGGDEPEVYTVDVTDAQHPTCHCAYFENRAPMLCKHIVAVVAWHLGYRREI